VIEGFFIFVGVTTSQSAVVGLFDEWCQVLGCSWKLRLWDIPVDAPKESYFELVNALQSQENVGALVTTHKARLFATNYSDFDLIEPRCAALAEVGVAYKRSGLLCGGVSDIDSGEIIIQEILDDQRWRQSSRRAVILGGGGAGLAAAWNLAVRGIGNASSIVVVESDTDRRSRINSLVQTWPLSASLSVVSPDDQFSDSIIAHIEPAALVVNATGLGKDRPGSPISDAAVLPENCIVWDFNYRGSLEFVTLARSVSDEKNLRIHDGFSYFASGWSTVMCKVARKPWTRQIFTQFLSMASS
jgi:shikimate dehydrogenase